MPSHSGVPGSALHGSLGDTVQLMPVSLWPAWSSDQPWCLGPAGFSQPPAPSAASAQETEGTVPPRPQGPGCPPHHSLSLCPTPVSPASLPSARSLRGSRTRGGISAHPWALCGQHRRAGPGLPGKQLPQPRAASSGLSPRLSLLLPSPTCAAHTAPWPARGQDSLGRALRPHLHLQLVLLFINSRSGVQLPFACVPWTPLCFDTPQRRPLLPPACPPLSWGPGASGVVTVYPWSRPGSRGHRAPLFLTPPPPPWPPSSARAAEALALGRGRVGVRDPPLGQPWPGLMPPWPGLGFQLHPTLELPLNLRFSLRGEQVPLPPGSARSGRAWKDPETQEALVGVGQEPAPLWSVGGVWVEPAGGCAKGRGGS